MLQPFLPCRVTQAKQANIFVQVDGTDNVVATWHGPKTALAVYGIYGKFFSMHIPDHEVNHVDLNIMVDAC